VAEQQNTTLVRFEHSSNTLHLTLIINKQTIEKAYNMIVEETGKKQPTCRKSLENFIT
jgi:hypothetical protein